MTITTEELQKLLDAATPGPWPSEPTGDGKRIIIGDGLVDGPGGYEVAEVYSDDCDRNEADANAALIRMSRDLAAELIAARAKIAAAEKLAEAVLAVKRICETQMRTADFHGTDCRCWRCKEDAMFAALSAYEATQ